MIIQLLHKIFGANMNKKISWKTKDNVIYLGCLKPANKREGDELYDFISGKLLLAKEDIMELISR